MNTTISFIIPAYNAARTLRECLDAIVALKMANDEIIVVNDASIDNTLDIAEGYNNCKVISTLINQGAGHARNKGALEAVNEIVVFVDADVIIKSDDVDKLKKYFIKNENVQTITMNVDKNLDSPGFYTDFKNLYMNFIISESPASVNYVYGSCCATRRKSFVSWPESIRLTEDSLWGFKQKSLGYEIHCLKDIQVTHLKKYTLKCLIKNDFYISAYFAKSFLEFNRWNTLYTSESFGHTSKVQKISLMLLPIIWILFYLNPLLSLLFLSIQITINGSFYKFIYKNRGALFTLKSVFWYLFAYHVYLVGIIYGTVTFQSIKVKIPKEEVA